MTEAPPAAIDVLLVEDDPDEVELTLPLLREVAADCRVEVARDGEEALDLLLGRGAHRDRIGTPPPRLVLLDLKLPRLDGLEVLRALRASPRVGGVPVVILTSSGDPRELAQCYHLGANSCVSKPIGFEEFRSTIRALGRYWLEVNAVPGAPVGARAATR